MQSEKKERKEKNEKDCGRCKKRYLDSSIIEV
jgi:hypothetical protein